MEPNLPFICIEKNEHLNYREEIQNLAKDNENMEEDLKQTKSQLDTEKKNKRKVDKILADASEALKIALRVSVIEIYLSGIVSKGLDPCGALGG